MNNLSRYLLVGTAIVTTLFAIPASSDVYTFRAGNGLCLEDRSSFM